MRSADWSLFGWILTVLSAIFFGAGGWIWLNVEGHLGWSAWLAYLRYEGYIAPLFIVGISFLVIGVAFVVRSQSQEVVIGRPQPPFPMSQRYCRFCGAENKSDAVFCEKCGKQIGEPM